jgi:type VI secretion system protein ImpK
MSADYAGQWIAIRVCSGIMFASGKADVLPMFKPVALRIAQILEKESGPVKIIGHTDNQPLSRTNPFKNNLQLSVERAKAVAALMGPNMSQPARLMIEGRGSDDPIADNKTAEGRAQNRRVEFLLTRSE